MKSSHLLSALSIAALTCMPIIAVGQPLLGVPQVTVPSVSAPGSGIGAQGIPGPIRPRNVPNTEMPGANAGASLQGNAALTTTVGRITAINGSSITVTLANGSTKTFAIDSNGAVRLQSVKGTDVAVQTDEKGNVIAVQPADQRMRATVMSLAGRVATLKLSDGRTLGVATSRQVAAQLNLRAGTQVIVATRDAFRTVAMYAVHTAATVVRVVRNRATLLLNDGRKVTLSIAGQESARSSLKAGSHVVLTTDENGRTRIDSADRQR